MQIEYHLLPGVKNGVRVLAALAHYSLWACAGLAVAEPLLLALRLPLGGILCGMVSAFLLTWCVALLAVLAAWCHPVLLAGQGSVITRWLLRVGALLAPLAPVCRVYTLATGRLLLYRQAELPLILGVLLLFAALVNIPRMAAAPRQVQLRVVLLPLLLLAALVLDLPGMLIFATACKLLAAWLATAPLRRLARTAPRIISMPVQE